MTFFAPPPPERAVPRPQQPSICSGTAGQRGQRWVPIDRSVAEAERVAAFQAAEVLRLETLAKIGQYELDGVVLDARDRPVGVNTRASKNNRAGLSITAECPGRKPRGMLFALTTGFYDKDGFWCVKDNKGGITVYRGANQEIRRHMTPAQHTMLKSAQSMAARRGMR